MNNKIYILPALLSVFLITSCSDKLEVNPVTSIDGNDAIKTSSDVEGLLVGAYNALSDGDLYGGNILRDAELIADDYKGDSEIFWDGTFVAPGEIWTKSMLVTNDQAQATWLDGYSTINICNLVLENLNLVSEDRRARVEGEAKFIRGTVYFELVRIFARTWTDGDPTANPGVPIVLTATTLENAYEKVGRSTVAGVYAQVISDLEDAATLLPDKNGFFANRFAPLAMLSRVYLMQNNYANARDYANHIIAEGSFELEENYEDIFNLTSPGTSSEDIFSIQVTTQDGVNNMNTFFASSEFGGRGDIYIEAAHFALYEEGDERLSLFYDDERTGKWTNQFGSLNILRLAEIYLTRAEANFRLETVEGATPAEDINTIRRRVELADLDAETLTLEDILKERHLELAFEGHRIHDIKRTQGFVGSLPFDASELVFPIPQRERNINTALSQNDGYGN
jgi:starch-binding outer membrane protein, SusD/RagB family